MSTTALKSVLVLITLSLASPADCQNFLSVALDQTFGIEGAATGSIDNLDGACAMQADTMDGGFYLFGIADDGFCPDDLQPFLVKHTATGSFESGFNAGAPLYLDQFNCTEYLLNSASGCTWWKRDPWMARARSSGS